MAETFLPSKPCMRGHTSERLVSNGACCACQRANNAVLYVARREEIKARTKAYRDANLEQARAKQREYRLRNRDEILEKDRVRSAHPQRRTKAIARLAAWNKANQEKTKARIKAWGKKFPHLRAATSAKRRAAELRQMPAWADHDAIALMYRAAEVVRTTGFDVHVDHVVPLQGKTVSGLHVHNNLRLLSARVNQSKSNHF